MKGIIDFVTGRLRSFSFAGQGLLAITRTEHNFQFHLIATITVLLVSSYFKIQAFEWGLVAIAIGTVLMTEALNTALEKLCDYVHLEDHPQIKLIKDVSAAAVFLSALLAFTIGCIVFIPYMLV